MRRSAPALLAAGLAALLSAPNTPVAAQNVSIVVPNSLATTEGNANNSYPFNIFPVFNIGGELRLQQVYNASQFGTHRLMVTGLEFRPDGTQGTGFSSFIDDIQINLSTTASSADNMNASFAANLGADNAIVVPRSNLVLTSNLLGLPLGPKDFDIHIELTTPFVYRPTLGNLLLDVRVYKSLADTTVLDAERTTGDSVSRLYATSVGAANGARDTLGLVTRFKAVKISTLTGKVNLQGTNNIGIPVRFEFRDRNSNRRFTRIVAADINGNFQIDNIPSSDYDIGVKGSKWLRKTIPTDLTAGDVSGFNYTLLTGDVNDDNVVDINDLLLLIMHYNQVAPSIGYLYAADLNNDGSVDINDLLLLIGNYNVMGDN